jgi:hypothetical protein
MADLELDLAVCQRQCPRQRFGDQDTPARAVTAWADRRNAATAIFDCRCTSSDAWIKLKRLYPASHE